MLALDWGCRVTVVDPTDSYVEAGTMLTARMGLADLVSHQVGDALELPFDDEAFEVVWTQNSDMNIADKQRLYDQFQRVLRPEGRLALQEPMAGLVQPVVLPLMWAPDATSSFLRTPDEVQSLIEAVGFRVRLWEDTTSDIASPGPGAAAPTVTIQSLVLGDTLAEINQASQRNFIERRLVAVQAVFDRL